MNENELFVEFPFRKLIIKVHRRDMLHSLLKHVSGTLSQVNQKQTFRIEDLGIIPLNSIQKITPALYPGCEFMSDDEFVYGKAPRHTEFVQLFLKESAAHKMFQLFNKELSIHELSFSMRKRFPMDENKSLLFIRGLFLFLTELGFTYPKAGIPNGIE